MAPTDDTGPLTTDELFRRHADFVARFLARLGVPNGQLEDALQEVFLVAHRNGGYRPGLAKPTSYLANIALRAAARHRQRDGAARTRHSEAAVDETPGELEDPARALQTRQDMRRLQRALERLPESLCTTLLLVEIEGESCVSVAAGLGCPVGTIYWRLHQARKQLRAALLTVDAAAQGTGSVEPEIDERAQPARSWMMVFGLGEFKGSEAERLLQLARAQRSSKLALDQLLARHHELVRTGVELPAWAGGLATSSASWGVVLGAGPIAAGLAAGGAIAAVTAFSSYSPPAQPAREHAEAPAAQAAAPSGPSGTVGARAPASEARAPVRNGDRQPERSRTSAGPRTGRTDEASNLDTVGGAAESAAAPRITSPAVAAEPERSAPREPAARDPRDETKAAEPSTEPEPARLAAAARRMGRAMSDAELAEMREIARAERLVSADPKRALALTRAMEAGFPEGRFHEERAYLEVMALAELERTSELREEAAAFLRAYPAGLYSDRVRRAMAGEED